MSFQTWATEKIQELFTSLNDLKDDSKSIDELDIQEAYSENVYLHVSVGGVSKKMSLQRLSKVSSLEVIPFLATMGDADTLIFTYNIYNELNGLTWENPSCTKESLKSIE